MGDSGALGLRTLHYDVLQMLLSTVKLKGSARVKMRVRVESSGPFNTRAGGFEGKCRFKVHKSDIFMFLFFVS